MERRALLITGICCVTAMQLRSARGAPPGGIRPGAPAANPGPIRPGALPMPGMGGQGFRFGHGGLPYWPFVPWPGGAPCTSWTSPDYFGSELCAPNSPPPGPQNLVAPPVSVVVPPPPAADNAPSPAQIDSQHWERPAPDDIKASADEHAGARLYQSPTAPPVVLDEYPSLIVLKSGGVYGVTKYWIKAKTLYFVTPNGLTFKTPLSLLEQVYPGTMTPKK